MATLIELLDAIDGLLPEKDELYALAQSMRRAGSIDRVTTILNRFTARLGEVETLASPLDTEGMPDLRPELDGMLKELPLWVWDEDPEKRGHAWKDPMVNRLYGAALFFEDYERLLQWASRRREEGEGHA